MPTMPSPRRVRVIAVTTLAIVVTIILFTSHMRRDQPEDGRTLQDFYHKTMNAMEGGRSKSQVVMGGSPSKNTVYEPHIKDKDGDGTVDADDKVLEMEMRRRLEAAEQRAKELANAKAPLRPDPPSEVIGVGSSSGGQQKIQEVPRKKQEAKIQHVEHDEEDIAVGQYDTKTVDDDSEAAAYKSDPEDTDATMDLEKILKRSPVIIFSKTYCPYSKRAKSILLDKYAIEPLPFVVELDEHQSGAQLQAKLATLTGRKTVPNILINGKSVGGADEVAEMDARETLIDQFKAAGGKRITVRERYEDS